jgi:CBS domain-containing protein
VQHTATILDAARAIYEYKVRGLAVVDASGVLKGILLTTDLVNYLGGGEYYRIVEVRHGGNIFKALRDESVGSIYNPSPVYVDRKASLTSVLELMIGEGIGFVPVVYEDGVVYGVITEHDLVRHLADKKVGRKVRDSMTETVVMVDAEAPLREAARLMVAHGFRRLPVVSGGEVKGMITAKDYVSFFGSHEAFKAVEEGKIEEVLSIPVYEVMTPVVYTISPDADVGDAAREMIEKGVSSLLVVEDDEVKGIITERDVLVAVSISG